MKKSHRIRERITVKMSKEFLDSRREKQRALSVRHIAELADAMLFNRWVYNGESIKFDIEGYMVDGQHRCAGGIKAGKSFLSDIVYNLPTEAYYTIDQKSKKRSAGDVLKMNGELNTNTLSSALSYNIAYHRGNIVKSGKQWIVSPDSQQIAEELIHHPAMRESVLVGRKCFDIMGPAPLSFLHYLFSQKDKDLADTFFHQLKTGEDLSSKSPILFLRKMLLEDKIQNKAKLPMGEKLACIIKAWNLMRQGKIANSQTSIKWTSRGKTLESFPEVS